MNITFILESSYNSGGMERMLTTIANAMAEAHHVTVITALNEDHKDFFPFMDAVTRVDLGIRYKDYPYISLKREYKQRLAQWLKKNSQEIVVSLGSLEFFFLPNIKDGSKKVFWFHFAFNYDIKTSCYTSCQLVNTAIGRFKRLRRIRIARRYDKMIVLSRSDLKYWKRYLKNVICIYNPITITPEPVINYSVKRAIAVGRIEYQKGFDYLVKAWGQVHKKYPNWQLNIYGGGKEENIQQLQTLINKYGLHGVVILKGTTNDIAKAYSEHSIMVLSSRYEGFGLVLVEGSACGLPLVSFDCKQGPSEIINHGINGYLVSPVGNIQGLANSICHMISNEELRKIMGKNAMDMSQRFSLKLITKEWLYFFEGMLSSSL